MKRETAIKFIEDEVRDLGFSKDDIDVKEIILNAIELSEISTKKEVIKYLEDALSFLLQG